MTPRRSTKRAPRQKRIVYRVRWVKRLSPQFWCWSIKAEGVGSGLARTQREAVKYAVRWAHEDVADGRLAQVVVHGRDGRIRFERTYGADPRRRKG